MRPFLRHVPLVVILGLISTALEGLGIGLLIPLFDVMFGGTEQVASGRGSDLLMGIGEVFPAERRGLMIGITIFLLIVLKNVIAFGNSTLQAWIYGRSGHGLRIRLSSRLAHVDSNFLLTQPPSRLLNVISNESWRAADAVHSLLSLAVSGAATLIFALFLIGLSVPLTLGVLAGLVVIQAGVQVLTRQFQVLGRNVTAENQGLAARMLHQVSAWRLIRMYGREDYEVDRFAESSDRVRRAVLQLSLRQGALGPLIEILYFSLFFLVAGLAWYEGIPFSVVATFIVLLYRLQPQVRGIQNSLAQLRGWTGSLDEVEWLLSAPDDPGAKAGEVPAPRLTKGIEFDAVSFEYGAASRKSQAISDASFEIAAGCTTALIGRSGSGKSTIANLICGLIVPSEGRILVDGVPLVAVDRVDWLSRIAIVSAELELVDGTIAENIRYGAPEADDARLRQAAIEADAESFILELPLGFQTKVSNRGHNLSAGQRQRLALARAIIRDPDLLILDEATNAMDVLSETAILEMLSLRRTDRTTIIISHHPSVIAACNAYVLIEDGRVTARGDAGQLHVGNLTEVLAGPQKIAIGT